MLITLRSNRVNGATGRAHQPVTMSLSGKEPTVIKSLAMIACVVGVTLLASAGADARGNGGEDLFATPVSLESESAPQTGTKDRGISEQGGK
jgi:hypothetical protein